MLFLPGNVKYQKNQTDCAGALTRIQNMDATTWAVSAHNIQFKWPKSAAATIDIETLGIRPGECVLVMGPSGTGKTTLLNLMAGVIRPDSGTFQVLDTPMHRLTGPQRDSFRADHIGFVFQMFNLIPYLSLIDNVILPLRFSICRRHRVLERAMQPSVEAKRLLSKLGLSTTLYHQPVTKLSVGQQQRVAVARALIGRPELVICDEPTSSLDAGTREVFLELLFQEVGEAEATLVFVSHDRSLAPYFDRTIFLPEINKSTDDGGHEK